MSEEQKKPFEQAGEAALRRYRSTKLSEVAGELPDGPGGMELFRAYVEHRAATSARDEQRVHEILASFDGLALDLVGERRVELLRLQILNELDDILRALLVFCGNQPKGKDQLSELRLLLQIDKGRAPVDNRETQRRWAIEQQWVDAYLAMQDDGEYLSENQIAQQIAKRMSVSSRTAINHWSAKKKREPHQALWAEGIEAHANRRGILAKERLNKERSKRKAATSKPKKSDYRKRVL
ncbi:hypothetical protein ABH944_002994 [Caballeronia udeis]|uniref:Uncharacterized protein n=1 Tax=Caballeronia udeis TaxID=1232866 RepID=A0ABW8MJI1_9BURK